MRPSQPRGAVFSAEISCNHIKARLHKLMKHRRARRIPLLHHVLTWHRHAVAFPEEVLFGQRAQREEIIIAVYQIL